MVWILQLLIIISQTICFAEYKSKFYDNLELDNLDFSLKDERLKENSLQDHLKVNHLEDYNREYANDNTILKNENRRLTQDNTHRFDNLEYQNYIRNKQNDILLHHQNHINDIGYSRVTEYDRGSIINDGLGDNKYILDNNINLPRNFKNRNYLQEFDSGFHHDMNYRDLQNNYYKENNRYLQDELALRDRYAYSGNMSSHYQPDYLEYQSKDQRYPDEYFEDYDLIWRQNKPRPNQHAKVPPKAKPPPKSPAKPPPKSPAKPPPKASVKSPHKATAKHSKGQTNLPKRPAKQPKGPAKIRKVPANTSKTTAKPPKAPVKGHNKVTTTKNTNKHAKARSVSTSKTKSTKPRVIHSLNKTYFQTLESYEVLAVPVSETQYPWIGKVVHSSQVDYPYVCTAVCIEPRLFITAARCIANLRVTLTTVIYENNRHHARAFVLPDNPTKQMFDDIGFIVAEKTDYQGKWPAVALFDTKRTDDHFWWFADLNLEKGPLSHKVIGYATRKFLHKLKTPTMEFRLMELNVVVDIKMCSRLLSRGFIDAFFVPCYHSCNYTEFGKKSLNCQKFLGTEGAAVINTKTNKLLGVATWGTTSSNIYELPVGFAVPNSAAFFKDKVCARKIRDDTNQEVNKGYYQKLCGSK